jgi:hypothetical protein
MWRRTRWILLALLLLLVGGAAAVALTQQPKLDDARGDVDTTWSALRSPLDGRYQALSDALVAFANGGGGDRAVSKDLGAALSAWTRARQAKDPAKEAAAANAVEAEASRLAANAQVTRFSGNDALTQALNTFDGRLPPQDAVTAYNRAVTRYQDLRDSTLGAPVARVLGFDERPTFVFGP